MAKIKYDLLGVAHDCHSSFHLDMCSPVDLFVVHVSHNGFVFLLPNHDRGIDYFFGTTMAYICDFLNKKRGYVACCTLVRFCCYSVVQ